ncbi:MAG: tetratricopeptide repeat protein [Acidobacteria bacterium]|nr:tetratricopeptide repeat protein [Acidobacteriota bacterium]
MQMWKNPIVTAVAGILLGFFAGFLVGQGQPGPPPPAVSAEATNPHAGVPGAPPLPGMSQQPPEGGRTTAAGNPQLLEQVRNLEKLIAQDPGNYDHLVQMGNTLYDLGNYFKAVDFYEKARGIKDDSPDVLTDLGVCYRETGRSKESLVLFDRAADMNPQHWQSRYNAAVVRLFDLDDPAGAQVEVEKLKTIKHTDPTVAAQLAGLEQEIKKRTK